MKNLNDFQCTSLKRVITKWPPSPCVPTDTAMKYQGGGALFLMILHNWTTDSQLHVLYIPPYFLHSFLLSKFLSLSLHLCYSTPYFPGPQIIPFFESMIIPPYTDSFIIYNLYFSMISLHYNFLSTDTVIFLLCQQYYIFKISPINFSHYSFSFSLSIINISINTILLMSFGECVV